MTNTQINKITKEIKTMPVVLNKNHSGKRFLSTPQNNLYPINRKQKTKLKGIRKKKSGVTLYQFIGEITIYTVNKLKMILIQDLQQTMKLEFDLYNVDKFDSAGFQLFIFLDREAKKAEKFIQIIKKSENVSRVFTLFGVYM
ncbi:MAG: STAS domain-containing protein [Spirochaetes bacterium]|nr:STAS domain-containing protein [Spirochaetota bacterium]